MMKSFVVELQCICKQLVLYYDYIEYYLLIPFRTMISIPYLKMDKQTYYNIFYFLTRLYTILTYIAFAL